MANFTTDFDRAAAGYSPDRVDSLTWAFSELLVEPMKGWAIYELTRQRAEALKKPPPPPLTPEQRQDCQYVVTRRRAYRRATCALWYLAEERPFPGLFFVLTAS